MLPPHDRLAIARFLNQDDRKRALVSRLLQYSLVRHVLRIPFRHTTICRTPQGKPYRKENGYCSTFPNFDFNTSHQGDYIGIASEPLCLVGLDIASVSKPQGETTTEFVSNFSSYLSDHEWDCIARAGTPTQVLTEFYRYWCLKEAFVKAIGAGVGFGLHRLEFHHEHWTNISIHVDGDLTKKWRFWIFKLDEMHLASIAKGHPEDAVSSYKETLSNAIVAEEQLHSTLESPEEAFTLWTEEQLTQSLE
ncbi:hypothetical protein PVAP13_8NG022100 [Panicum virgatum]|uniref:holo-[acyl-carrier-protein] synthase n=1 Tax=Panicum virgatum TaxID=38727 RepID=A0A8T0P1Y5_PANVG|nr:hypothetical protein PVAP13_8NG022100 [Panicum virgatum]